MSDSDEPEEKPFCIEVAKQGRAVCKKCKQKCLSGEIRVAKLISNPFGPGKMKNWHHVSCIFEVFAKQRAATKRIESPEDIDGWNALPADDKNEILKKISDCNKTFGVKSELKATPQKKKSKSIENSNQKPSTSSNSSLVNLDEDHSSISSDVSMKETSKDNLFREFRRLVSDISRENSYKEKTRLVNEIFTRGSEGNGFKGDIILWCRLLLPGVIKRTYNLQSKQLVKLFSKIFQTNQDKMLEHLQEGDISLTIQHFFEKNRKVKPSKHSNLTLQEVDGFLQELTYLTKEDEQMNHFKSILFRCTSNDLKILIRLINHDLRMSAGAKHVFDGVGPGAYEAFQASRDIKSVIERCMENKMQDTKAIVKIMTPIFPMLAEACKSVEQAMKKCPNGMFSEIKYDGERVQVHKHGSDFKYFSRSLKPVLPQKVAHFKDFIPKAFPHATDLILDSEILMIDTLTGKPLPFGSLGVNKKTEFKDANVCLFVFDCIYYNGETLVNEPIKHRKKILKQVMTEIPNHIVFSEMEEIYKPDDLTVMVAKVLNLGLEGLVLKDLKSTYEPGKRHWLKIKKDYLFDGAMADSADLIVLGAWYGTGKKGGMMSIFLMGCYDEETKRFCTVTKVHTGHDDKTLENLQHELDMVRIPSDGSQVPDWLHCTKTMVPDFVAIDPKKQPVWEIMGAEFTQHDVHTADGISIRFPRVSKIRRDKNWKTATSLEELKTLVKNSKHNTDFSSLMKGLNKSDAPLSSTLPEQLNLSSPKDGDKKKRQTSLNADKSTLKRRLTESELLENNSKRAKEDDSDEEKSVKQSKKSSECKESELKEPIPNYFDNIKLILEDGVMEAHNEWVKYFMAYGGLVLNSEDCMQATHVLHLTDSISDPTIKCPNNARHIIVEWIKDTVASESVQDFRPYTVRWIPSLKNN